MQSNWLTIAQNSLTNEPIKESIVIYKELSWIKFNFKSKLKRIETLNLKNDFIERRNFKKPISK